MGLQEWELVVSGVEFTEMFGFCAKPDVLLVWLLRGQRIAVCLGSKGYCTRVAQPGSSRDAVGWAEQDRTESGPWGQT